MIGLFQLIFIGHVHKWKILDTRALTLIDDLGSKSTGIRYILQCEECGTIKKKDLV